MNCSSCQATYIGKTIRQTHRRLKEHGTRQPSISTPNEDFRRSARIATKRNKTNLDLNSNSSDKRNGDITVSTERETHRLTEIKSATERNVHETKHDIDWKNCSIINKDRNSYRLLVRESLATAESQPVLNAKTRSVPPLTYSEGCSKTQKNIGKKHTENTKRQ